MFHNPRGMWTLFVRETLRFITLPNQALLPPVVTSSLYIVIFGFVLGSRISEIDGFSYISYVFPGLILMAAAVSAFENSASSLFISRWETYITDLLVAPISFSEMVVAMLAASTTRGIINGLSVWLICGWLIPSSGAEHPMLLLGIIFASSLTFAGAGLLVGLWAERWDNLAVLRNFFLTPLVFLGGVFFSIEALAPKFHWVMKANPIFYMISATRHSYLGRADLTYLHGFSVTFFFALFFSSWAVYLFWRGYNLRT